MRTARRTYEGAYHHAMNRGYEKRPIFLDKDDRDRFVSLLEKACQASRIVLLAYCVMDNHYHILLQNLSGRMPLFFKILNGEYAVMFRKKYGGKGYVFEDRYKTMLIQDEAYLMICLAYTLNNPVKAGLCRDFTEYPWSSSQAYFSMKVETAVKGALFEDWFGDRAELDRYIRGTWVDELPVTKSELGLIIGGEQFFEKASGLCERRAGRECPERRREDDFYFEPEAKVIQEFENKHQQKFDDIPVHTHVGKRLRGELLVALKERAGLSYREIAQMDLFSDIQAHSLGTLYRRYKTRQGTK
jgi:REP element-mobilizing transposase RayT